MISVMITMNYYCSIVIQIISHVFFTTMVIGPGINVKDNHENCFLGKMAAEN